MQKKTPFFSVVTATHNRCNYLGFLYKSLASQSYKKIEWIVGNDGSTDKTDKLIKSFIKEKKIKIKYIKSNVRIGKSKMDNLLFPLVSGKYQCYCGSDDYFKKNAFEKIFLLLKTIPSKYKNKINGVMTQSVDQKGYSQTYYDNKFPKKNLIMSWEDFSGFIKGDATVLEKSKSYKNHKFKEVDFLISESTLMNKIHKNKLFLVSNLITKVMKRAEDSISFGSSIKYCRGYAYSISINVNKKIFNKSNFLQKIWIFVNYWRYVWHGDINILKAKKMWVITKKINLYYLLIPLCIFLCIRDIVWKKIEKTHLEFEKNKNKAEIEYVNL